MIVSLSRRYRFAASHRLNVEAYSEERNREVFGKCNNPHGHGHNYVVEVTVVGPIHPITGMICSLAELDGFAKANVLETFDGRNLNTLAAFQSAVPSTEHLAIEIYRIFERFDGARVERVRIEETGNNSFDYFGETKETL